MKGEASARFGNNEFRDYVFSAQEWSAPVMVDPDEIKARIKSLHLEGRTIKNMRLIGLCYNYERIWIENHAYHLLDQLEEDERQKRSEYDNIAPDTPFGRYVEIDEPLLILFEDEDVFEIDTPQEPEFRFSMNCIPWGIEAGTNSPNLHAGIFFAPCIGRTIKAVEVKTFFTDKHPMYNDYFDDERSERELVSSLVLRLDDGNGIRIGGNIDYCEVEYIGSDDKAKDISFKELKPALFNWQDIHIDPVSGFEAYNSTFFFGRIGEEHAEHPFMTLSPEKSYSRLHIAVSDFLLFDWTITVFTGELFDEYGYYEFSAEDWRGVLDEAEKILGYDSFDGLFDYLVGLGIQTRMSKQNRFLISLNLNGADFWKNRDRYERQLKDMREWTALVLSEDESMLIGGF